MIRRLQFWLGEQAGANVPAVIVWLVGVRHRLFNWRELGDKRGIECTTVHRSWWGWMDCQLRPYQEMRAHYEFEGQKEAFRRNQELTGARLRTPGFGGPRP